MYKKTLLNSLLILSIFNQPVLAIESDNPVVASAVITKSNPSLSTTFPLKKDIYLVKINLTPQQRKKLIEIDAKLSNEKFAIPNAHLPSKVDLGMNGVPVLDQGKHGTCVTFSNTAAVDALLGKGNYISQLCNLELSNFLSKYEDVTYGWSGANGPLVLNQMLQFGIINKDNQKLKSCAGITEYPINDPNNEGNLMSVEDFKIMHENIFNTLEWIPILTQAERAEDDPSHHYNPDKIIFKIKKSLAAASNRKDNQLRFTFASYLPVTHCSAGACARHNATDDTWALTQAILNDQNSWYTGGHEMIITGYDDHAIAIDNEGATHHGLFILRNSYGDNVGDHGTYYMTYDFFKKFVVEVNEIILY